MRKALAILLLWLAHPAFADGHGTLSDTLDRLAAAYIADPRLSDVTVDRTELSVTFALPDGTRSTSYPDNLHAALGQATSAAERDAILAGFVSGLIADLSAPSAAEDAPLDMTRLMPVLRDRDYGAGLGTAPPLSRPFFGGMAVFLVEDQPNSARFVTPDTAAETGLDFAALEARATANLTRLTPPPQILGDGIYLLQVDGFYEASYLLNTPFWQNIDRQIGTIVAAAPARDVVVFVDGELPGATADLAAIIAANAPELAYPLSPALLRWTGEGWALLR